MTINQTDVALTLADEAVQAVTQFVEAFEEMEDVLAHATNAGINMISFDVALENSSVKHVDGATINKLGAIIPALRTWLGAQSVTGTTYLQALHKIKK